MPTFICSVIALNNVGNMMTEWDCVADKVEFNLKIMSELFVDIVPRTGKTLDFGCGYGRVTNELYELGFKDIVGVDSSTEMINRGENEFPHLELIYLPQLDLPFADASFDTVMACAVFTCIPDKKIQTLVVSELFRVLKPNGVVYLAEFCSDDSIYFTSGIGVPMWHGRQNEIEDMFNVFSLEKSVVVDNKTMTGHRSQACHIVVRKTD